MFFRNAQIYRLPAGYALTADQLAAALAPHEFTTPTSNELQRQGWDETRPNGGLVHAVNGQLLIRLRTQKKLLPATVINQVTKARAAEMEEAQGFKPGKKAMKELKERVADELLPRAFDIDSNVWTWIDPIHGWLVVDAASPTKADEVIKHLLKAVDRMPLESLRVRRSPVGVMTEWLQADDSPSGFTVDMDTELRATGESKAAVRYVRHTLEADEVRRHIAAGKQCTRLAMTWESKISFTLTESLAIKGIKALGVLKESESSTRNDDERFDGDFMLMTGELAKMLADVVDALGGEADGELPVARPAPRAAPAPAKGSQSSSGQPAVLSVDDHIAGQLAQRGMTLQDLDSKLAADVPTGDGSTTDPLYGRAVTIVRETQRASVSLVQRELRIGFNRAAGLVEAMEDAGVIVRTQGVCSVAPAPGVPA